MGVLVAQVSAQVHALIGGEFPAEDFLRLGDHIVLEEREGEFRHPVKEVAVLDGGRAGIGGNLGEFVWGHTFFSFR